MNNAAISSLGRITCTVAAGCLLASAWVGCETTPKTEARHARDKQPVGRQLDVQSQSAALGEAIAPAMSDEVFARRIDRLAAQRDELQLRRWLATYPEMAERLVVSAGAGDKPAAAIAAAWLDQRAEPGQGGWSMLIRDRQTHPQRYATYDQQERAIWQALRQGRFDAVAQASLVPPADAPSPWLQVEALRLKATASLAAGQPEAAAQAFLQAAQYAEGWDEHAVRKLQLFAALALEAKGDNAAAQVQRNRALRELDLNHVTDPMVLRLAIHTDENHGRVHGGASLSTPGDTPSQRLLHARLGDLLLQRGQPQAALLAWREAEAAAGASPSNDQLRLMQAKALIALRQNEVAMAMLVGLAMDTQVRSEALTMLGLLHIQRGQTQTGMAMLYEAVEDTDAGTHPDIHADAALALLATGNADKGLELLWAAREGFRQQNDWLAVRTTLENELTFSRSQGEVARSNELMQQLSRLQSP